MDDGVVYAAGPAKYDPNDKVLLYGAYNYDPKFDVLRAPMRLSTSHDVDRAVHDWLRRRETSSRCALHRVGPHGLQHRLHGATVAPASTTGR